LLHVGIVIDLDCSAGYRAQHHTIDLLAAIGQGRTMHGDKPVIGDQTKGRKHARPPLAAPWAGAVKAHHAARDVVGQVEASLLVEVSLGERAPRVDAFFP
jgi:hypothetical protein